MQTEMPVTQNQNAKRTSSISLSVATWERVERAAAMERRTNSSIIEQALEIFLPALEARGPIQIQGTNQAD